MSINTICELCHMAECERINYKENLITFYDYLEADNNISNKQKRFQSYQNWTRVFNGVLGRGNRILIPNCVKKRD